LSDLEIAHDRIGEMGDAVDVVHGWITHPVRMGRLPPTINTLAMKCAGPGDPALHLAGQVPSPGYSCGGPG
jgi:hypothetical protein